MPLRHARRTRVGLRQLRDPLPAGLPCPGAGPGDQYGDHRFPHRHRREGDPRLPPGTGPAGVHRCRTWKTEDDDGAGRDAGISDAESQWECNKIEEEEKDMSKKKKLSVRKAKPAPKQKPARTAKKTAHPPAKKKPTNLLKGVSDIRRFFY